MFWSQKITVVKEYVSTYSYDTTGTGINRAPAKIYFKYANAWYDTASSTTAVDPTIPAGSAIVVRKYTSDGSDKILVNASNVAL